MSVADVFISYSKADRDKVVMLAAYLEAEGWTVWWDTNLAVGDAYRDEIMKQLAAARAAIVLWTQNSIKSDFVRAEAGRAKADGKLIPVKDSDINYADIPLPFGEMHTEALSRRELIRAAVVAQLAKPQVQPAALIRATKRLRYHLLTWIGVIGSALTLFSGFRGMITMADWAAALVEHWHQWSHAFWSHALSWMNIELIRLYAPFLSMLVFWVALTAGVLIRPSKTPAPKVTAAKIAFLVPLRLTAMLILYIAVIKFTAAFGDANALLTAIIMGIGFLLVPLAIVVFDKSRGQAMALTILMIPWFCAIIVPPLGMELSATYSEMGINPDPSLQGSFEAGRQAGEVAKSKGSHLFYFYLLALATLALPVAALPLVAPLGRVNVRLVHALIGLSLLLGLNELSKYGPVLRQLVQ